MFVTKGMPEVRPFVPVSIVAALLLVAPSPAQAGSFPYWGVSFGTPLRTAAHVGVSFGQGIPGQPDEEDDLAFGTGPTVEAAVGAGGASFGAGRSFLLLTGESAVRVHADLKAVALRTFDRPRGASAHATYAGIEGGLSISFVRFGLGVAKRLEGRPRGADVLVTWSAGLQIRLGRRARKSGA